MFRSSLLLPSSGSEQSQKRLFRPWRWRQSTSLKVRYVFSNRNDVIQENLRLHQPPLWQPPILQISGSRSEIRKLYAVCLWSLKQSALSRVCCSPFCCRGVISQAYRWGCPSHSKKLTLFHYLNWKRHFAESFRGNWWAVNCSWPCSETLLLNVDKAWRSSQIAICRDDNEKKKYIFRRVRDIGKSDYKPRHVCLSFRPSAWNNSAPTGRIFMKSVIWVFH